jgi:copper homeostasis protein
MTRITLEVCVDTLDDVVTSKQIGAGRIELCSSLELGGLTPSYGLVRHAVSLGIPVFAMIRPRAGDFVYSDLEVDCMHTDIEILREAGISGFVFGALDSQNELNETALSRLIAACKGLPATLNRAFDISADPIRTLDRAIELGFDRILTSGASASVTTGLPLLSKLFKRAKDRIIIVPGGGITPETVRELLENLPVREIHASCKKLVATGREASAQVNVGRGESQDRYRTDPDALKELLRIIAAH